MHLEDSIGEITDFIGECVWLAMMLLMVIGPVIALAALLLLIAFSG